MAKRELQFDDGKSRKFWTIELKGTSHTVTFGRLGTNGQTRTKDFDTKEEARKSHDTLVEQKLGKGYVDAKRIPVSKKVKEKAPTKKDKATKNNSKKATSKKATKKTPRKKTPKYTLDVREDVSSVREFIYESLRKYADEHPKTPVTGLEVFYGMQNGFLELQLWTSPGFEPFADSNHAWARELKMPHWLEHYDNWVRVPTTTIGHDGQKVKTKPDADVSIQCDGASDAQRAFGRMLVHVLEDGLKDGLFENLVTEEAELTMAVVDDEDWGAVVGEEEADEPETIGKFTEIGSRNVEDMEGVGVSQDGSVVACAGNYVFAFNVPGYEEFMKKRSGTYEGLDFSMWSFDMSPDGDQLAIGWYWSGYKNLENDGGVERWSLSRKKRLPNNIVVKGGGGMWTVTYSPDSEILATGGADKLIRFWNAASGKLIREIAGHEDDVRCVRFSPDGNLLASADRQLNSLRLWDTISGEQVGSIKDRGEDLAFSPDGKLLAVVSGHANQDARDVSVWDVESRELACRLGQLRHTTHVVAFSKDGRHLATGTQFSGFAELWDVKTEKRVGFLDPDYTAINGLAFVDDRTIAVAGCGWKRPPLLLWDITDPIAGKQL